jgi:hypothetical protein
LVILFLSPEMHKEIGAQSQPSSVSAPRSVGAEAQTSI